MTRGDDDIAAALPGPPFPAPARRRAAIEEALRRFDGGAAAPAAAPRRPAPWARPYAGALAGAFLVAVIGLPFVWTAFDDYEQDRARRRPAAEATLPVPAGPDRARADSPGPGRPTPAAPGARAVPGKSAPPDPSPAAREPGPAAAAAKPPSPAAAKRAPAARGEEPTGDDPAQGTDEVVVTGTRIRRPNLNSAVPVTSIGSEEFASDRRAARAARRGDWNACTIDDPGRSLDRCRASAATLARGARGRASAPLADGLDRAWSGDLEGATAAFDRAIELAPRSSTAWLNRGLAWRRRGDLDRALADLDRAVLYAPGDARAYYHRSLVLRERGDLRRARADEERAVQLDPRYAPLVRSR
ncbi:MAG TPA: tetratricopeptide repeat protein [Allosphingosinicella sp.]|nr:tetratricopeptide repeat protein [Allosphingosinicella sp.]